ncbi:MAG: ABC transporter ATP-binding protein [Spirochaetes bacterium]|nr:MAG: ABC transporter ATP-binding protein [Spirochaetota bacterium]
MASIERYLIFRWEGRAKMSDPAVIIEEEFTSNVKGDIIKRIFSLLALYKTRTAGFLFMIAFVSVSDAVFTYLSKLIVDQGIASGKMSRVLDIIAFYGGAALLQAAAVFSFIYLAGILGERVAYDLRKRVFNHLQDLPFSYFDRTPVGWIMSRVTSDTAKISELLTWGLVDSTWGVLNITTSVIFMMLINVKLALMVTGILPFMIGAAFFFQKKILKHSRAARKQNSRITGFYSETITGVKIIKSLNREAKNLEEFKRESDKMYDASYKTALYSALFLPSVKIIGAFALCAIIWYGGTLKVSGAMSLGGIQAFIFYVAFMLWPIQDLARVWASMQGALASGERIFSLLDIVPEIRDRENSKVLSGIGAAIVFKDVSFYYSKDAPVLAGFNLTIQKNETLALVGATGGGKSTIVNLLSRFYEPVEGEILINGIDYRKFTLESLQSRLGIVLQTPHLFSGTIRENIRFGRLDADMAEIEGAAKLSMAHEFITGMEKGYDTEVGEGGGLLSVGQKQLVCLARAILSDPDLFIMDEATSSIDPVSESLIQSGLDKIMENRTSIIIAHRLSTIKKADRILVIAGGRIMEEGDHRLLLQKKGDYYRLYQEQFVKG